MPERRAVAYEPNFDITAYRNLELERANLTPEKYQRLKIQLDNRTRHNLETNLGERFNVEISQVNYYLENGQLINSDHDEPFAEIIKRGRDYRTRNGNPIDHVRESTELEGFEKVQKLLTINHSPSTSIVVISPKGSKDSDYQHNFFDVYQKNENGKIQMSRYTSQLSYDEFWLKAKELDPNFPFVSGGTNELTDALFLSHPLTTQKSPAEILETFHDLKKDAKTMTYEQYQKLLEDCSPLITSYLSALASNPTEHQITKIYNATLNFADAKIMPQTSLKFAQVIDFPNINLSQASLLPTNVAALIDFYGTLPVRQVMTGCGKQSGFSKNPWSVSECGIPKGSSNLKDQYGTLEINCEECGATYERYSGVLEKFCRVCSGTKGIVC